MLLFRRLAAAKAERGDDATTATSAAAGPAAQNAGPVGLDGGSGSSSGNGGGGDSGGVGIPTAGTGGEELSGEKQKWAERIRKLAARTTVPEFTEQTVGIITGIIAGQSV